MAVRSLLMKGCKPAGLPAQARNDPAVQYRSRLADLGSAASPKEGVLIGPTQKRVTPTWLRRVG